MATQYLTFSGTSKWAKYRKPDEKYGHFSIDVYLDDPSWDVFKASGLALTPKEDEDGFFVKFRRPQSKVIKNELVSFGPPEVEGATLEIQQKLTECLVGNGSKVQVSVVVYDTIKGKGHRLNKIKVVELVPYSANPSPEVPVAVVAQEEPPEALVAPTPKGGKKRPF